ncbi:hypothetical protein Hdeb2414_s0011g00363331 [Helianthus debilis subsp. tardiflorus]
MCLYLNMFSICSDMSDMSGTHLIILPSMYRVMLSIMFSICSDMSNMFCAHLVMFVIMYRINHAPDYVQYRIMFCISYVCFDSVSLYQFRPSISISLNLDYDSMLYVKFVSFSTCIQYLIQSLFYTCR